MTRHIVTIALVLGVAASRISVPPPPMQEATAQELDGIVQRAAAAFKVPGLAVAVVRDGQVILTKGYGVARVGDPSPVDEHTLFYIASATKAFTVTALGILADEGRFRIDDPVVKHLPEFALADKAVSDALTVRDLMSHRTGVPRADLFLVGGVGDADVIRGLARLAPQAPIRSRFTYQNQMYLVLGNMIERLSGTPWTKFVESRVLTPIGFVDGNAAGLGHWNSHPAATPHARDRNGQPAPIALVPRDPSGAGGVNASAADLATWLQFNLGDGTARGARVVGANVLAAMQAPNTLAPAAVTMPNAVLSSYGLGWFVHDYFGEKVVQHGGNGEGWTSLVWMMPQQRLGIAVLTNLHNSSAPTAIAFAIADRVLGRQGRAWIEEYRQVEARLGPPPLSAGENLTALTVGDAAQYEHPVYGRAAVTAEAGQLRFTYGALSGSIDGLALTWMRSDLAAVLGPGRASIRAGTPSRLLVETAGERIEFTRVR